MKTFHTAVTLALCGIALSFGEDKPVFPAGSLAHGEAAFTDLMCFRCHTLENRDLPDFDLPAKLKIHLGGDAHALWTRDMFAQAIMNPQHMLSPQYQSVMIEAGDVKGAKETPMPNFNQKLTVQQLIDLATFLAGEK